MSSREDEFSPSIFYQRSTNADTDFHIMALQSLIKLLSDTSRPIEIQPNDQNKILNSVRNMIENADTGNENQRELKLAAGLRALVLCFQRFPTDSVEANFPFIVDKPFDLESPAYDSFGTIFKEILASAYSYEPERQALLKKYMCPTFTRQLSVSDPTIVEIAIPITSELINTLGFLFEPSDLDAIEEQLRRYIEKENNFDYREIASLAQNWATYASTEKFDGFIQFVFDQMSTSVSAFTVLTTILKSLPSRFEKFIPQCIEQFLAQVPDQDAQMDDDELDAIGIQYIVDALASLDTLINTFPSRFAEAINEYCDISSRLLQFGTFLPSVATESNEVDEEFDIDEELDDDDNVPIGDDSWKIRKQAHMLCQTIIHKFPEQYFNHFKNHFENALSMIADSDPGAKSSGISTVLLIAQTYKAQLPQNVVDDWMIVCVHQLQNENDELAGIVYNAFTQLIYIFGGLSKKSASDSIRDLKQKIRRAHIPAILHFLDAIISLSSIIVDLASDIAGILISINEQASSSIIPQWLSTVSTLFFYSGKVKDISKHIALNKKVLEIATTISERQVLAINVLAVFVCIFGDVDTTKKSLEVIVKCLNRDSSSKQACSNLALISASPSFQLLTPFQENILKHLKSLIISNDSTVAYRSLWALKIGIESKLINPKQCAPIVEPLAQLFLTAELKSKLIAIRLLTHLTSIESISSIVIPKLQQIFTTERLTRDIVLESAEFLHSIAATKSTEVAEFINNLNKLGSSITETASLEENAKVSNISLLIGEIGMKLPKLGNKLITIFEKGIVDNKNIHPFKLRCIGELGARIPLDSHKQLIDSILNLVKSTDRRVFTAAAESIGMIASSAINSILPVLLKKALEEQSQAPIWIIAFNKLLKQVRKLKNQFPQEQCNQLLGFFIKNADFEKETSDLVADCICSLLHINEAVKTKIIEKISLYDNGSPVIARGVSLYIESITDDQKAEEILKPVIKLLQPTQPATGAGILTCAKTALHFKKIRPYLVKQVSKICKCLQSYPEHFKTVSYGVEMKTIDIGRLLRMNAIDTLAAFFSVIADSLDYDVILQSAIVALEDPLPEVQKRTISFLCKFCEKPTSSAVMVKSLANFVQTIDKIRLETFSQKDNDIQVDFLMLAARIHILTSGNKNIQFERMYASLTSDSRLPKIETDAQFEFNFALSSRDASENRSIGYLLMEKYSKEAAAVFTS